MDTDTEDTLSNGTLKVDEDKEFNDEFNRTPFDLVQDPESSELILIAYNGSVEINRFKPANDGTFDLISPDDGTQLEYAGVYQDAYGNRCYIFIYNGTSEQDTYYYKYIVSDGSEEE